MKHLRGEAGEMENRQGLPFPGTEDLGGLPRDLRDKNEAQALPLAYSRRTLDPLGMESLGVEAEETQTTCPRRCQASAHRVPS